MIRQVPKINPEVAWVMEAYPASIRTALMRIRLLIFETAATEAVGPLTETLKWGQPAYLTAETKAGSTIRLGWKASAPERYYIYLNCRTTLIDRFGTQFADEFKFEGNRAIVFAETDPLPEPQLCVCLAMALTYHRGKR